MYATQIIKFIFGIIHPYFTCIHIERHKPTVHIQYWLKYKLYQIYDTKIYSFFHQGRNLSDNWGGGGVYSYIRVVPDGFLLKSTQIQKKSVRQNMNIWINTSPPPITTSPKGRVTSQVESLQTRIASQVEFLQVLIKSSRVSD